MAENFNARIKNKRDTSANWTTNDPVILNGEIILVDTATGELRAKIGDGTKRYTELPFTDEAIKTLLNNKADADHTHSDEAIDAQYMPLTVMMEDGSFNSYLPTEMGSIKKYKIINSVDNAPVAAELIAVNNSGTETYAQIIRMYKPSTYNPDTEPNYAYKEWQRVISDVTGERVYGAWNQTFPIEIPETIEVDTELSTTSENPVQNKVVATKINDVKTALDSKAPTSHASSSIMYGVGTSTEYGHLKVADNLTTTTSGTALSANQGKVLNDFITKIENNTTLIKNSNGGFAAGTGAVTNHGGAIGENANSTNGGAIGYKAIALSDGGAVGRFAEVRYGGGAIGDCAKAGGGFAGGSGSEAGTGGAVGGGAKTTYGGAIGDGAKTSWGFAGGYRAKAVDSDYNGIDAIQLGTGTNSTAKTLQVYDYQLMDANGNIPAERLANVPQIIVEDNLTSTSSANALSAAQGKVLKAEIDELVTSIEEKANSDLSNLSDASTALANLGLTATATEINYTDGVTSNIQTQLNNKASSSHIQPASTITSGTFSSTSIKAATGTDYTTARIRNIQASTTDLTAGISALSNGDIYFVYE